VVVVAENVAGVAGVAGIDMHVVHGFRSARWSGRLAGAPRGTAFRISPAGRPGGPLGVVAAGNRLAHQRPYGPSRHGLERGVRASQLCAGVSHGVENEILRCFQCPVVVPAAAIADFPSSTLWAVPLTVRFRTADGLAAEPFVASVHGLGPTLDARWANTAPWVASTRCCMGRR
jgi:hypothetical protein